MTMSKSANTLFTGLIILFTIFVGNGPTLGSFNHANAQTQYDEYLKRQKDITVLAGFFGALHHLRRTCNPVLEAEIWRQRMQNLIALEEPDDKTHLGMVAAFNERFKASQKQYPECTRQALEVSRDIAFRGNEIVLRLTAPLKDQTPAGSITPEQTQLLGQ